MNKDNFRTYLFSYQHKNASWYMEIKAESPADAKDRIAKMLYATYEGELVAKIPAQFGLWCRLGVFIQNSLKKIQFPV